MQVPNYGEQDEIHPYYQDRERKNQELIQAWWYTFWIAVGIGMWYLMILGIICKCKH